MSSRSERRSRSRSCSPRKLPEPGEVATFDTNKQLVSAIEDGSVSWAIDQQPYVQGYEAIDTLWLAMTNSDVVGGGQPLLTGPAFIDAHNIAAIARYAARGTR